MMPIDTRLRLGRKVQEKGDYKEPSVWRKFLSPALLLLFLLALVVLINLAPP
jgi:hypothetical protein